jgi:HK97 family phage major capsid protein
MKLNELRSSVEALKSEIETLAATEDITPEQDARLSAALDEFEARKGELDEAEARAARIEAAKSVVTERAAGFDAPQVMKRVEAQVDVRSASRGEVRDAALKIVEKDGRGLAARQLDHVDRLLNTRNGNLDGAEIAKLIVLTENDAYRSAFMKGVTEASPAFTNEEAQALNEFRAMSSSNANGGFGVPVLIDPSIILTSGAADAPVLNVARIVTITTNEWKGVNSAGVSWSYDAEASEVSDDAPTLAQPTVPVHTARGFIPYSIEIGQDYPGFAEEMSRLLNQGYTDLVASASVSGSGTGQPRGIFTALDANTNVEVIVTTDGQFGAVDLLKVWKALPERYRQRAHWLMSTGMENQVRALSSNANGSFYTINLTEGGLGNLFGRPVLTTDYAPDFTGTTGAANLLVVGDFSNYVVAQRAGMTVELVSHLFGTTNARPTGQRGWFAYARHGMNSVNDRGFRILQND